MNKRVLLVTAWLCPLVRRRLSTVTAGITHYRDMPSPSEPQNHRPCEGFECVCLVSVSPVSRMPVALLSPLSCRFLAYSHAHLRMSVFWSYLVSFLLSFWAYLLNFKQSMRPHSVTACVPTRSQHASPLGHSMRPHSVTACVPTRSQHASSLGHSDNNPVTVMVTINLFLASCN